MSDSPTNIVLELCERANLSAAETQDYQERCFYAVLEAILSGTKSPPPLEQLEIACRVAGDWPLGSFSYGGTYPDESDCPREPGSRHARPEGLSAGARWLRRLL